MKLYYSPGTCSLSPHIILREGQFDFDLVRVDLGQHKTESGEDFKQISPTGMVPLLELDDGTHISEGAVIVQYLADQKPAAKLAPKQGSMDHYKMLSWLNWTASELHKAHLPLFASDMFGGEAAKQGAIKNLKTKYDLVNKHIGENQYLLGDQFCVADAYLFTILSWHKSADLDLADWANLNSFYKKMQQREAVQQALNHEETQKRKVA